MSVLRLDIRVGHSVQQQLSDARAFVSRETSCHMQRIQTIQLQQRRGGEERRGGGEERREGGEERTGGEEKRGKERQQRTKESRRASG